MSDRLKENMLQLRDSLLEMRDSLLELQRALEKLRSTVKPVRQVTTLELDDEAITREANRLPAENALLPLKDDPVALKDLVKRMADDGRLALGKNKKSMA